VTSKERNYVLFEVTHPQIDVAVICDELGKVPNYKRGPAAIDLAINYRLM